MGGRAVEAALAAKRQWRFDAKQGLENQRRKAFFCRRYIGWQQAGWVAERLKAPVLKG